MRFAICVFLLFHLSPLDVLQIDSGPPSQRAAITDHAKSSFYRAANAIFAKVGCFASEEVILELIL